MAAFDDVKIYENPLTLPRAIFSSDFTLCDDDALTLELISQPTFDPKEKPVIDAAPELPGGEFVGAEGNGESRVEIALMEDERIHCSVMAKNNGILWTTDAYYPGWKVRVDGKEARLLKTNYLFRGVAVPSGVHNVEFYYGCRPLRRGFLLNSKHKDTKKDRKQRIAIYLRSARRISQICDSR